MIEQPWASNQMDHISSIGENWLSCRLSELILSNSKQSLGSSQLAKPFWVSYYCCCCREWEENINFKKFEEINTVCLYWRTWLSRTRGIDVFIVWFHLHVTKQACSIRIHYFSDVRRRLLFKIVIACERCEIKQVRDIAYAQSVKKNLAHVTSQ